MMICCGKEVGMLGESILHVICLMMVQTEIHNKDQDSRKEKAGEEQ
jgi:hypothetical protein